MEGMAFLKQKRSFCIDPKKEDFISYGKAKFSYDLARLKIKKFGEKELRLVVASTTRLMDMGYRGFIHSHILQSRGFRVMDAATGTLKI